MKHAFLQVVWPARTVNYTFSFVTEKQNDNYVFANIRWKDTCKPNSSCTSDTSHDADKNRTENTIKRRGGKEGC